MHVPCYILQRCNRDPPPLEPANPGRSCGPGFHTAPVSPSSPDNAKILLFIEKQAIVQILCQQLVTFFDSKKIQDVSNK